MRRVRVNLGKIQIEAEGSNSVQLYEELAKLEEIFSCQTACGFCKKTELRHNVRFDEEKHKYYELICRNPQCKAKFRFGVSNKEPGELFPQWKKGKGKNKVLKENGGWEKYNPELDKPKEEED